VDRSSELRASDEQRDRAAEELRDHFAAGRITEEELDDRVQQAYAAQTEQDLRRLTADLPKLPATPTQHKAELAGRRGELQRRLIQETGGAFGLFLICTVIWVASGAHGQFWPIWVAIIPVLVLLRNGWRLYGPDPRFDEVERELESRQDHDARRAERRQDRDARRAERRDRR
jgi:hypothetical protein